ncbi:hypothetical protein AYO21_08230 [Fonsecaea monophora]|uniref:AMP-dependent synthetase/ligase domain-containing protein n=1 Tax=Fonsecaea monophora TaxID=254056 RepID=A0A177F2T3_9EURO|nr:hypothetical protein AYO21_08230 [Fonsecaea monophora]OAG37622.1 hypothetical protein AYO21_08230 [Fonsecaea monophora]
MDADLDIDRTGLVPNHCGPNVLPAFALFSRLLRFASRHNRIAITDGTTGYHASHIQLLTDILHLRNVLEESLHPQAFARLQIQHEGPGQEVFVNIIASAGYEFAVAMLAVLAAGAVPVPLAPGVPLQEACYFANKSRADAVLASSTSLQTGRALEEAINQTTNANFKCIEIEPHIYQKPLQPTEIVISSNLALDLNGAGLVIFTSGTTGPPKGVVMRRSNFIDSADEIADHYGLGLDDTVLHLMPVHHAAGIGLSFSPFLYAGSRVEFRSGSFNPAQLWQRWREGGLTFFTGVPTMYARLMQYFETHLSKLPNAELNEYLTGLRSMRGLLCGTSALPLPLQEKWVKLTGGMRLLTRYGATEFGPVFKMPCTASDAPMDSVGTLTPGVEVKLSEGDEGEILARTPFMFSRYLFDPVATANAHDADGYFKTGDIARKVGPYYFILGRQSIDIIKSGGYKISTLDVERELLSLNYIGEAMVVGVDDDEFGQRTAAVVTLNQNWPDPSKQLTLEKVRRDLRDRLSSYKLPTLLRVVHDLPKTATGKVSKKILGPQLFPKNGHRDIQIWSSAKPALASKL